jgi:hypothetical protein
LAVSWRESSTRSTSTHANKRINFADSRGTGYMTFNNGLFIDSRGNHPMPPSEAAAFFVQQLLQLLQSSRPA